MQIVFLFFILLSLKNCFYNTVLRFSKLYILMLLFVSNSFNLAF